MIRNVCAIPGLPVEIAFIGHADEAVVIVDAMCDTCGLHTLGWLSADGERIPGWPLRVCINCLRSPDFHPGCGGQVIYAGVEAE